MPFLVKLLGFFKDKATAPKCYRQYELQGKNEAVLKVDNLVDMTLD